MVHPSIIEARLGELRFRASRWFRAEIHELQHILMDHEKIIALACGRYFGSYALLVATDQRLLLIDKRVFFMNIEDTRYDMISEIDFNSQVYSATVTVFTMNKTHKFTTMKHKQQLRDLTNYVQRRVMEFRNQQSASLPSQAPAVLPAPYQQPGGFTAHMRSAAAAPYQAYADSPADAPPLGTSYNYSPATTDDSPMTFVQQLPAPGVAQLVGSAAMQGTHHRTHKAFHPYIQGSLMTRRPISTNYPTQNY